MSDKIKCYPLTHPQKNIWYTEKVYPGTSIGNIAGTLRIKGKIDYSLLEKAINKFIEKNDSMRLKIIEHNGEPRQYISKYKYQKFDFYDFSDKNINELYKWSESLTKVPLGVIDSELFYFSLIKINENDGGFYLKIHHIIADAWTISLLGSQIIDYYSKFKNKVNIGQDENPTYVDYILNEEKYNKSNKIDKDKEFWNNKFKDFSELTALKVSTSNDISTQAKRKTFITPARLTQNIYKYCKENKTSIFSLFLAALSLYLNRVTGKEDLVFGTVVLNRSNVKEKSTAGMFISTVPFRVNVNDKENFKIFSQNITKEWMIILKHQKYPYNLLLKEVREKNKIVQNLFNIVISYQNAKFNKKESEEYETRWHFNGCQTDSLVIHINDRENEGHLIIDYDFLTDLFRAKEIDFIHQHIINILWHALDNPLKEISKLEMLSEKEKHKIFYEFNDTKVDYQKNKTIQELFEEQVERTPNDIALVFEDKQMTYRELNGKSNQLAILLREKGVKANDTVGIIVHRSFEMIVGILAILKSGGAYVPIDPFYPKERINYMLQDSFVKLIITEKNFLEHFSLDSSIIDIYDENNFVKETKNLKPLSSSEDLAYIIYTSGSTGKPKGVLIQHKAILNTLCWRRDYYNFDKTDAILQIPSYAFDSSVEDIFTALLSGAKLVLVHQEEGRFDINNIKRAIIENNITHFLMVPSLYKTILHEIGDGLTSLKSITIAGESFTKTLIEEHYYKLPHTKLLNEYGPTENSVCTTVYELKTSEERILIGKPIFNTKCYIFNKSEKIQPIGVSGELYISGAGLSKGYLNSPELNSKKFMNNPYFPEEISYKTGDLAQWLANGDIEFLGRIDNQVKIHGYRIELGEIEDRLCAYEGIKEAVVVDKTLNDDKKYLCAYIVARRRLSEREIKTYLTKELPYYMVPEAYVFLNEIPLTPNGKIDKKALPQPSKILKKAQYASPRNTIERIFAELWAEVLEIDGVGIDDNIFDLGADSLSILQVQTRLLRHGLNANTQDFYNFQTVREISKAIKDKKNDSIKVALENKAIISNININSDDNVGDRPIKNILLTGTTGFLGMHILHSILTNTNYNIYCLMRDKSHQDATERISRLLRFYFNGKHIELLHSRIQTILGDISKPKFNLSFEDYEYLGTRVDTVIHAAGLVKHFGEYNEFEKINVLGTQEVIDFAAKFDIKLNHVSTTSVSGNYIYGSNAKTTIFTENSVCTNADLFKNVYVKSKYEAEKLIFNAAKDGVKANIFRVGNLTGRFSDGAFQINVNENAFYRRIKSIIDIGAVQKGILKHSLEFTPIDLCAKAITKLINLNNYGCVFHIMNHNYTKIANVIESLNSLGFDIKILFAKDFSRHIKKLSKLKDLNYFLEGIINDLNYNQRLKFGSLVKVESLYTQNMLQKTGFIWPVLDNEYFYKIFSYLIRVDYIRASINKRRLL